MAHRLLPGGDGTLCDMTEQTRTFPPYPSSTGDDLPRESPPPRQRHVADRGLRRVRRVAGGLAAAAAVPAAHGDAAEPDRWRSPGGASPCSPRSPWPPACWVAARGSRRDRLPRRRLAGRDPDLLGELADQRVDVDGHPRRGRLRRAGRRGRPAQRRVHPGHDAERRRRGHRRRPQQSDGLILTNNHVVAQAADGGGSIEVAFNDGKTATPPSSAATRSPTSR